MESSTFNNASTAVSSVLSISGSIKRTYKELIQEELYLNNGTKFADSYCRVVNGGRGDYIELLPSQVVPKLYERFTNKVFDFKDYSKDVDYYYYWLVPETDPETKVYFQLKTVAYADYIPGYLYIAPDLIKEFKDPDKPKETQISIEF